MQHLIDRDLRYNWHPCMQMKDLTIDKPLVIDHAQGCFLHCADGRKLFDATASWWCKSLGHRHPMIQQAIIEQMQKFEQVIFANTTYESIIALAQGLSDLTRQRLTRALFASDGSCAVEIAMKMSVHVRAHQGQAHKYKFIALSHAYHGETALTLAVSDCAMYQAPYMPIMPQVAYRLQHIPYVTGPEDPLWHDCSSVWPKIQAQLEQWQHDTSAIILEPLIQAAGGMRIYSQSFLQHLCAWAKAHDIHVIADEMMTGMGRTGQWFACDHAQIMPDFLCLGKGLTAGSLPLSVTLTHESIYQYFFDDYATGKAFLHSHTQTGNALAVASALSTLQVMRATNLCAHVADQALALKNAMLAIANETGYLTRIRALGAMVAADIVLPKGKHIERVGYRVMQAGMAHGILLRPLGNTLYWTPPLIIGAEEITYLAQSTKKALLQAIG